MGSKKSAVVKVVKGGRESDVSEKPGWLYNFGRGSVTWHYHEIKFAINKAVASSRLWPNTPKVPLSINSLSPSSTVRVLCSLPSASPCIFTSLPLLSNKSSL